jgi:hypothetical protein
MPGSISDARAAVIEERERILASIREMEATLADLDAAIASLDRLSNGSAPAARATGRRGRRAGATQAAPRRGRVRGQPSMVSLIESYIEEQGRKSAHANDVLAHLEAIGRAPGGKNPKATVQTTLQQLQKRGRIKNIGRNRWRIDRAGRGRNSAA